MKKAILLVFAHPDDESFGTAGISAKYTHTGIPVYLVCATRGEKGTRLDVPDNVSIEAHRSQQDAREFFEMLKEDKDSVYTASEFFYLAKPRRRKKEASLFPAN